MKRVKERKIAVTYNYSNNHNELIKRQRVLNEYAIQNEFITVHKYIDKNGTNPHKRMLNEMLYSIKKEEFEYIICYDINSLSDNAVYLVRILKLISEHSIELVFINEGETERYKEIIAVMNKSSYNNENKGADENV